MEDDTLEIFDFDKSIDLLIDTVIKIYNEEENELREQRE